MTGRGYRDVAVGAGLAALGAFVVIYAASNYRLGTVAAMGPGLFPMGLGVLLAILGVMILIEGLLNAEAWPVVEWSPLLSTLAAIVAFALMIERFGLVPSIVATIFIASLGPRSLGVKGTAILAVALCLMAYLIFSVGLNLQIQAFRMPF